jgi:hypothetical protein
MTSGILEQREKNGTTGDVRVGGEMSRKFENEHNNAT